LSTWSAILLAIAGTVLINFGFALQKRGATLAVTADGKPRGLFTVRTWRAGLGITTGGWALYFISAKFAPISIIQPALGAGLAVLALFSVFYLHEKISAVEWAAFGSMLAGIVLLGLSTGAEPPPTPPAGVLLAGFSAAMAAAAAGLFIMGRREGSVRPDVLLGLAAGLLIGIGSLHIKAMYNFDAPGVGESHALAFGACLPIIIVGNILGIVVMQYGFRRGKALVVVPVEAVLNKVVAIVGGMLALGETLPADATDAAMRIAGFALILGATGALARFGR
jgi:drug/metabolite transporter (DMT)-like permease